MTPGGFARRAPGMLATLAFLCAVQPAAANVQRLVVPGEHAIDAVLIDIDTANAAQPFSIRLLGR